VNRARASAHVPGQQDFRRRALALLAIAALAGTALAAYGAARPRDTIAAAPATHLAFTVQPAGSGGDQNYTADETFSIDVTALTNGDNPATGPVSVSLSLTGGAALTGGGTISTVAGVAHFPNVAVRTVGTSYSLSASSTGLAGATSTSFAVTPGKLDSFVVNAVGAQVAGTAFSVTATAKDHWGNVKSDYNGPATVSGTLSAALGTTNGAGDDFAPSYASFGNGSWASARTQAGTTAFTAEGGRTVTVSVTEAQTPTYSGVSASGTSSTFAVGAASPNSIIFKAASNDLAFPFDGSPANTKVGTPIYSKCAPPVSGPNPCATTGGTAPNKSTGLRTLVRDLYGNPIGASQIRISRPTVASMGTATTAANGIAEFADNLTISPVNDYVLTATVVSAATVAASAPVSIVNEVFACDGSSCVNNGSNANSPNNPPLQKTAGKITTVSDFYDPGNTNVLLSTQFTPGSDTFQAECGSAVTIGQSSDLKVTGQNVGGTAPSTVMVMVLPKDTLKKLGITSRGVDSFNICLGALKIADGPDHWNAKNPDPRQTTLVQSDLGTDTESRQWGLVADCGTAGLVASDPCIGVRSKQAATIRAYLASPAIGWTTAQINALGLQDSDMVTVIKKGSPWDGKTGYK